MERTSTGSTGYKQRSLQLKEEPQEQPQEQPRFNIQEKNELSYFELQESSLTEVTGKGN